MKKSLKALPVAVCGVLLGFAALGNLLQAVFTNLFGMPDVGNALHMLCGVLSSFLFLAIVLKLIFYFADVRRAMRSPVTASVSGTLPMALMLLSVYWKPVLGMGAEAIWLFATALHILLIIGFTFRFFRGLKLENVFASYYIVYVGIAVAAVSAPAYGMQRIGAATFWFGFFCMLALIVLVTVRYLKIPVKEPAKPLLCIYAAPVSLCLAGYVQSVQPKFHGMLIGMLIASTAILIVVLTRLPSFLKLPFYPSYAAFTFPFVITAIASMQSMACLKAMGMPIPWFKYVVFVETALASVLVFYTLFRYGNAVFKTAAAENQREEHSSAGA